MNTTSRSFTIPSTEEATSSVSPISPPSQANKVNLADLYPDPTAALRPSPAAPLYGLSETSLSHLPADRVGITSRSHGGSATKGKRGVFGFMAEFLNSNKRPEISKAYDPVHVTPVGFNSSTGEFTGFPKERQQPSQDSGISDPAYPYKAKALYACAYPYKAKALYACAYQNSLAFAFDAEDLP